MSRILGYIGINVGQTQIDGQLLFIEYQKHKNRNPFVFLKKFS